MHTLVLAGVLSVWIFTKTFVDGSTITPSTIQTTTEAPITTTPSTSQNTCIFFKENSCVLNYSIVVLCVVLFVAALIVIGCQLKGKRNLRRSGKREKRNNSTENIDIVPQNRRYGTLTKWTDIDTESHKDDKEDIIPTWMLFVFSIDRELPSKIKWTCGNTGSRIISEKQYNKLKNRKVNDNLKHECNSLYQFERTIGNKLDKVNVVFDCSEHLKTTLVVEPSLWERVAIANQSYDCLRGFLQRTHETCYEPLQTSSFQWAFRSNHHESYKILDETESKLNIKINDPGEYRCKVQTIFKEKQVYYFMVKFLGKHMNPEDVTPTIHRLIRGVPSVLDIPKTFMYFGYGSNLNETRIHEKNPSAVFITIAELKGYKLDFISMKDPTKSLWHGGVATITQSNSSHVWGAVWKLDVDHISSLNKQEGFYKAVNIVVKSSEGKEFSCRTYLLESDTFKSKWDNRPSYEYKNVIIEGALDCEINDDYIAQLLEIEVNDYNGPPRKKMKDNNE